MKYGGLEYAYAAPFANALADDAQFRAWVIGCTKFAAHADGAKLLRDEMAALRGRSTSTWWRSHFSERCRCAGCSGQETDLLAVFEAINGLRFALHIEVKQPTDRFPPHKDQAGNYALRATCWVATPPLAIVPHADATTLLLCSALKLDDYAPNPARFGAVITFEQLRADFPAATVPR